MALDMKAMRQSPDSYLRTRLKSLKCLSMTTWTSVRVTEAQINQEAFPFCPLGQNGKVLFKRKIKAWTTCAILPGGPGGALTTTSNSFDSEDI